MYKVIKIFFLKTNSPIKSAIVRLKSGIIIRGNN